ncbi:CPCC family cysteine-rich protein [Actinosynnema sp. NPDC053489]|uniref:CPCC family cysteine-rich protein n=1 Tax=Actinosynnema sp. NPDC053489 TaxID=3363916 RepID=UPI0037C7DC1A
MPDTTPTVTPGNSGSGKVVCPCCGYHTLDSRGDYDICEVCFWDDGQDDHDADVVRGDPNGTPQPRPGPRRLRPTHRRHRRSPPHHRRLPRIGDQRAPIHLNPPGGRATSGSGCPERSRSRPWGRVGR